MSDTLTKELVCEGDHLFESTTTNNKLKRIIHREVISLNYGLNKNKVLLFDGS